MKKELNNKNRIFFLLLISLVIIIIGTVAVNTKNISQEKLDSFAACLTDKEAKFFGAFWCPHCEVQKEVLGNSEKIPYTECSTPDSKSQKPVCSQLGIKSYPTWRFADGQERIGGLTLKELALISGCQEPI